MNLISFYITLALFLLIWLAIEATIKVVFLAITHNNIKRIDIGYIHIFNFKLYNTTISIGLFPLNSHIYHKSIISKTKNKNAFENILMNLILIVSLLIFSISLLGVDLWIDTLDKFLSAVINLFNNDYISTTIPLKEYSIFDMFGFMIFLIFFFNLLPLAETYLGSILHSVFIDFLDKKRFFSFIQYGFFGSISILFLVDYLNINPSLSKLIFEDKVKVKTTKKDNILEYNIFSHMDAALLAYKYSLKEHIVVEILSEYQNKIFQTLMHEFTKDLSKDSFSIPISYSNLFIQMSSQYKINKSTLIHLLMDSKILRINETTLEESVDGSITLLAYKYSLKEHIVFEILSEYQNKTFQAMMNNYTKELSKDRFSIPSDYYTILTQISNKYEINHSTLIDLIIDYKTLEVDQSNDEIDMEEEEYEY